MKMSELIEELKHGIEMYGDSEVILRNKNEFCDAKEIFDAYFYWAIGEFVITFKEFED